MPTAPTDPVAAPVPPAARDGRDASVPLITPTWGEVGPGLDDVEAVLALAQPGTFDDWALLAHHPALYQGWARSMQKAPALVKAAARLAPQEVLAVLKSAPDRAQAVHAVGPVAGMLEEGPALNAVLGAIRQKRPDVNLPCLPWRPEQRAAQEVIVGLLLAAGARPNAQAWSYAASVRQRTDEGDAEDTNPRLLQRLLDVASPWDPPRPADACPTLLHTLGERRSPWPAPLLARLLHNAPDVDHPNSDGASALAWAAGQDTGPVALVRALLEHGADPHRHSPRDGRQAVHRWAWSASGDPALLDALLEHGADRDAVMAPARTDPLVEDHPWSACTVPQGLMPVHVAAMENNRRALDHLLALGVAPDVPDTSRGNTPLHWAVLTRSATTVERLLRAVPRLDTLNRDGLSPLQMLDLPYRHWPPRDPDALIRSMLEDRALRDTLNDTVDGVVDAPARERSRL